MAQLVFWITKIHATKIDPSEFDRIGRMGFQLKLRGSKKFLQVIESVGNSKSKDNEKIRHSILSLSILPIFFDAYYKANWKCRSWPPSCHFCHVTCCQQMFELIERLPPSSSAAAAAATLAAFAAAVTATTQQQQLQHRSSNLISAMLVFWLLSDPPCRLIAQKIEWNRGGTGSGTGGTEARATWLGTSTFPTSAAARPWALICARQSDILRLPL